ncbi:MAG: 50S ribosomal protein L29 [Candidatus Thermoplasmatota archaeon]|nr:50S ribosomal protein L29 [Candidatus Thermoplasmatota archaeon]
MALLRLHEIREMNPEERTGKMRELRDELMRERGVAAMGGAPPSPGRIKALRIGIARLATIMREEGEI